MKIGNVITGGSSSPDTQKLESLVHYIAHKCSDPTRLGSTKLNKVLWYADTSSYLMTGKAITGARYTKQKFGPVPKDILKVRDSLKQSGAIAITDGLYFGKPQTQFVSLKRPDLSGFSADEISMVDDVLDYICDNHTATSISNASHDAVWEAAEIGEEIPLQAVFASRIGDITGEDIAWAKNEALRKKMAA